MNSLSDPVKGMLLSALGFSFFAVSDAVFKYLSATYSTFELIFGFGVFSILIYVLFSGKLGGLKKTFQTKNRKLHLLRALLFVFHASAILYAFSQLPLATVYALIFITPIVTTLLAIVILKERVSIQQWVAIVSGFCGVLIILRPGGVPVEAAALLALFSALGLAGANIIVRFLGERETPLSFALFPQILILTITAFLIFPGFSPALPDVGGMAVGGLLSAAGALCLILAFRKVPATKAAPFHYIQMVWAIALGYVIFGDTLDLWTGIGALVIMASGFWLIKHEKENIPDLSGV